jgi:hypothetical protein
MNRKTGKLLYAFAKKNVETRNENAVPARYVRALYRSMKKTFKKLSTPERQQVLREAREYLQDV